jgi:hypothetical protein
MGVPDTAYLSMLADRRLRDDATLSSAASSTTAQRMARAGAADDRACRPLH